MKPCVEEIESGSRSESRAESTRKLSELWTVSTRKLSESSGKIEPRVGPNRSRTAMPSVGMRRTTRVFGVVKGADGARVLRSGRRLLAESGEGRHRRTNDGEDWFRLMKNNGNGNVNGALKCKQNGWAHDVNLKQEVVDIKDDSKPKVPKRMKSEALADGDSVDRMFGIVYSRKRKRIDMKMYDSPATLEYRSCSEDKMYGLQFVRRPQRKKSTTESMVGFVGKDVSSRSAGSRAFSIVVEGSCSRSWFSCFLSSILSYMKRARVTLSELAAFLLSQPICGVYSFHGIRFLQDSTSNSTGMCNFFGPRQCIPMFSVDFSAVPLWFTYMHLSMVLRVRYLPFDFVNKSIGVCTNGEIMVNNKEHNSFIPSDSDVSESETLVPEVGNPGDRAMLHPSVRASKLAGRNTSYRNGLNSRSIQKRRSSLRRRRARNPSLVGIHKASGALVSDLISSRKNGIPFSSVVSKNKLRRSVRRSSTVTFNEVSSTMVGFTQGVDSSCCSANILVIEADKCRREEGANVMLEISASKEWLLVVKKDGVTRYTHKAQKIMRPCSCNRFTHAIIWTGDDNWRLEFPSRQDWFTFKDLYKECSDRNVPAPTAKVIPVPGVHEVLGYEDSNSASFCRTDSYISLNDDEVSRAMAQRTANYDMDSEDEEWLKFFNNECFTETELHEHLSEENFELMVDAFEKAFYCSPDDYSNEKAAANLCLDLGRREVVVAVYSFWMKKRKQKRTALLRVFQGHQAKKAPLIPKPVLRKRRSLKRQASQFGRGKQPIILQAIAAEQDALEEQNAMLKVEEAKVSANRSVELAVVKRQKAQFLMENADLATYKAATALRIAEAARVAESPDAAVLHFFD